MQTNREKLDYLVWSAKDKINKLFDVHAPTEETHAAIQELRGFLEARAAQTATPFVPAGSEMPYSPKAPPVLQQGISAELAALL